MLGLLASALFMVVASSPAWSPDGDSLAYTQTIRGDAAVVIASRRDGTRRVLTRRAYSPQWSPSTQAIAYIAPEEQSGNLTQLRLAETSLFGHGDYLIANGVSNFAWSSNGDELYYDEGSLTCRQIYAVSAYNPTKRRAVTSGAAPLPSPDGKHIAYLSPPGVCTGGFGYLSVANIDGSDRHVVVATPVRRAAWSPDGTLLAVEIFREHEPLEVVGADGSDERLVGYGTHPAWSPDGAQLAYLSEPLVNAPFPRDEPYLTIVNVRTSVVRARLLTASAENGGPAWSPDGRSIALSRALERGGYAEGLSPGFNRFVSMYIVPVTAPAKARRTSLAACELLTPACSIAGGPGGNALVGTRHRDVIWGYGGDDRISSGAGDDELRGGSGNDELTGGPGRDVMVGGSGGEVVFARDGTRDFVYCGSGYDIVIADRTDSVARDCDRVVRG